MSFLISLLTTLLIVVSLFLIGLVLIQRGRGGGLAGAFGGAGGSSAFGTKAGDVFTRITIGVAAVWFLICMLLVVLVNKQQSGPGALSKIGGSLSESSSQDDSLGVGADKGAIPKESAPSKSEGPATPAPSSSPSAAPPQGEATPSKTKGASEPPAETKAP